MGVFMGSIQMKKTLSKSDILGANDLKFEYVDCPEWGGRVRVRGAMAIERDEYDQSMTITKINDAGKAEVVDNFANAKARLVVKCIVDDNGNRLFSDSESTALGKKASTAIDRIYRRIQALSAMTKKAQEELEKNSETGQDENSPLTLPATSA